nr:hypothetical protein [Fertoeibacter niger]
MGRVLLVAALLLAVVLAPVAYTETACRGAVAADDYAPILPEADRRAESRTFLTWPEWHIVHAYDDYAAVIAAGNPHDFGFLRSIGGFWSSLCTLNQVASGHGGATWQTKQMVYVIGVSFTAELLLKAAYEETLGRMATMIRGRAHAPLDDLSAQQAAEYARFLQQVPWYKWDFRADAAALAAGSSGVFRDRERRLALGLEYHAKAAYAGLIAAAVAGVGGDALTLRAVIGGMTPEALAAVPGVTVIGTRPEGVEVETPRYRAFTELAVLLAAEGADFVEIAGNDDIMLSVIADAPLYAGALLSLPRQGHSGTRHLLVVKVAGLADALRGLADGAARLEHVHDY